jgi:hypothetical protein
MRLSGSTILTTGVPLLAALAGVTACGDLATAPAEPDFARAAVERPDALPTLDALMRDPLVRAIRQSLSASDSDPTLGRAADPGAGPDAGSGQIFAAALGLVIQAAQAGDTLPR